MLQPAQPCPRASFVEPTCAFCTVGSYASLSVCPSVCPYGLDQKSDWIIIHISESDKLPGITTSRPHLLEITSPLQDFTYQDRPQGLTTHRQRTIAVTAWAHCQRQVAFFVCNLGLGQLSPNRRALFLKSCPSQHSYILWWVDPYNLVHVTTS